MCVSVCIRACLDFLPLSASHSVSLSAITWFLIVLCMIIAPDFTCWCFKHSWLYLLIFQIAYARLYLTSVCWCLKYDRHAWPPPVSFWDILAFHLLEFHTYLTSFFRHDHHAWFAPVGVADISDFTPVDVSNVSDFHLLVFQIYRTSHLLTFQTYLTSICWCFRHTSLPPFFSFQKWSIANFTPVGVSDVRDFQFFVF